MPGYMAGHSHLSTRTFITCPAGAMDDLYRVSVEALRPTQSNVGMIEVNRKASKLSSLSKKELKSYLRENPVPVVLGPGGEMYAIDHHHLCRAVMKIGRDKVFVKIVADFSDLSRQDFWSEMIRRNFVYLKDQKGRNIETRDLPKSMKDLKNNRYRSLAGVVRRLGGFSKDRSPSAEFVWAEFFRSRISFDYDKGKTAFNKAVKQALKIAQQPEARSLPGYRYQCRDFFTKPITKLTAPILN